MIIYYAIGAVAILGAVAVLVLFRKQDNELATGKLATSMEQDRERIIKDKKDLVGRKAEVEAVEERNLELYGDDADLEIFVPPDPETIGVSRRQFLNRGIIASFSLGLGMLGIGVLKTLYPNSTGGFGEKISVGSIDTIKKGIKDGGGFLYYPSGRMWITEYPTDAIAKAEASYPFYPQVQQGLSSGVVALFQTCPHLGCRVPECKTSQWFECPCHGSQYNRVGEKKGGPAPRGMDRFPMEVSASGDLIVDTGEIIPGPTLGTNTTGQEAEGPTCLSSGGGH